MTIGRMRIACWLTKAADAHTEYEILLFFCCYNDYTNATQCYITRTLPVLLVTEMLCLTMLSAATVSIGHCGNANDSGQVKCLDRMLFLLHCSPQLRDLPPELITCICIAELCIADSGGRAV
jgi:hypothetical protein